MKITEIDKYYNDQIKFLHPYIKEAEFKRIMTHGFMTFFNLTKWGADISIKTWRHAAYCGRLFRNIEVWAKYIRKKYRRKLRLLYNFTCQEHDGVYYFGLRDEEYEKVKCFFNRKSAIFNNVLLFKMKEECFLYKYYTHFVAVYRPVDLGFCYWEEELYTRSFREIAYRDDNGKIVFK